MRNLLVALRAAIFDAAFLLLWFWVALGVRAFDLTFGIQLPGWTRGVGIILMAMGGAVVIACVGTFVVRGHGTPAPFDPPRQFVAVGPYKYVRNPMYIGAMILLVGFGLYQRSISILCLALVWLLLVHLLVVFYEEPSLRSRFGAEYEEYCRSVSRWIPTTGHPS